MASLYRKWRSRSFEDLVGQDHVVRTLRNAVRQSRVAHAYLFTGPRGTGKTSTARILAKALNCLNSQDGNPCNRCENCVAANEGRALDVIEIDAASNTSVDNVRELRERVGYAASEGRYKVYIIDEVHRLSGAAFDAFLKTLEEPPAHVVFVFASTEPHKVPATIMSRCQRFDFKRMSLTETVDHLRHVSNAENIEISDDALLLLGQSASGSMRDALGLLDQVAAYCGEKVGADDVRRALGLADPTLVARVSEHMLSGELGEGLLACASFVNAGGDPGQLRSELVGYWRALLLRATGAGAVADVVDPALLPHVDSHASRVGEREVVAVLTALTETELNPRYDVPAQLSFEMAYVRAALLLRNPANLGVVDQGNAEPMGATARRRQPSAPHPTTPAREHVRGAEKSPRPGEQPMQPAAESVPSGDIASGNGTVEHSPLDRDRNELLHAIVAAMRSKSPSLQAVLRSGFILSIVDGVVTIGFEFPFHANVWTENEKRKLLEEAVAETLGASYRVVCVRTTKEEVKAALGADAVFEDDGFVEEAAQRLREWHARQLGTGSS